MAYIDKLCVSFYTERTHFITWCIRHNPKLLHNIYDPYGITQEEWNNRQSKRRNVHNGEVEYQPLVIANFTRKQDKFLYWHCPLDFVRSYLNKQCGYKDNWFVKLFWRK